LCDKSHEINHVKPERNITDKTYKEFEKEKVQVINFSDFVFIVSHVAFECITLNTEAKKHQKLRRNLENKFHMKLPWDKLEDVYLKRFRIQVDNQKDYNSEESDFEEIPDSEDEDDNAD